MKENKIIVQGIKINLKIFNEEDFISLTDIARHKNLDEPKDVVKNWLRNKNTIEFLGLWERINNPNFKGVEFDSFWKEAGLNSFVLSPQKWVKRTDAIGLISKSGKGGGTYAHKDIALEFASWISAEFKLYLIKEFQRLKEISSKNIEWNVKRTLTKINYKIHTDAIKNHLIPKKVSFNSNFIYADEADILNLALFGMTAKEWRDNNPKADGNIRDCSNVSQLVCLANLENLNAVFIKKGLKKEDRLKELNNIAIEQMKILVSNSDDLIKLEEGKND